MFDGLLQHIPWGSFDRLVAAYGADQRVRSFDSRDHLIAMLGAALGGLHGLRQTVAGLAPGGGPLRLIGRQPPRRSTLAEANRNRDAGLFVELLQTMLPALYRSLRREMHDVVRLIDSTQVNLGQRMANWIGLHRGEPGAKIHMVYDPRAGQPVYFDLTSAKVNDITAAKRGLPIEPGATYVFDLGYYDFGWWAALRDQSCRFVTRLKRNTPLRAVEQRTVAPGGTVLSDGTGRLPERMARSRRNPFPEAGREIVIRISTGRTLRLFTNDLDSPAEAIADLYKERWQIELFFKWIKQNLRISRFMGNSENAVRLQIATALIAYILVRLTQLKHAIAHPAVIVLTVIRGQLFTRRPIPHLLNPPPRQPPKPHPQLQLFPSNPRKK
ncbi:MAG: IS4 family transposase [Alphaproteobacteria bacterium]|nr:IS4 family transposase [Alphaproteobacteria bacterium]